MGTLSVTRKALQMPIHARNGSTIDILVENQGRVFYGPMINQRKGILSNVYLAGHVLSKWHHYRLFSQWSAIINKLARSDKSTRQPVPRIPTFFAGTFTLPDEDNYPLDTFLEVSGWSKGVVWLNGHNLGRYWPIAGPQLTLYAPAVFFRPYPQSNSIVLFELERGPCTANNGKCTVKFVDNHIINGTVPTLAHKKHFTFVQKET